MPAIFYFKIQNTMMKEVNSLETVFCSAFPALYHHMPYSFSVTVFLATVLLGTQKYRWNAVSSELKLWCTIPGNQVYTLFFNSLAAYYFLTIFLNNAVVKHNKKSVFIAQWIKLNVALCSNECLYDLNIVPIGLILIKQMARHLHYVV